MFQLCRTLCLTAMLCAVLLLVVRPAQADFAVCNKSSNGAVVAIAYKRDGDWRSEGWWRVRPKQCRTIIRGPLRSQIYYLHAAHEGVDGDWDGNKWFCVKSRNFSLKGRQDCRQRGLGHAGFFEIDTGKKLTWVQNLSD